MQDNTKNVAKTTSKKRRRETENKKRKSKYGIPLESSELRLRQLHKTMKNLMEFFLEYPMDELNKEDPFVWLPQFQELAQTFTVITEKVEKRKLEFETLQIKKENKKL